MSVEPKRGCGYRKVGGLYLVCKGRGRSCGRLPLELVPCPTCGGGVRQSRGWTWIDPSKLFENSTCFSNLYNCDECPIGNFEELTSAGLIWIGKQHYKTVEDFERESVKLGISRRIPAVPKDFKPGETWVFLAHPEAIPSLDGDMPGVFKIFMPDAIEQIVTESQAQDEEEMNKLKARGITPVAVPDDDPDHQ